MSKVVPRKKKAWLIVYSPEGKPYLIDSVEQLDDLRAQIEFYREEGWTFADNKGRKGKFNLNKKISGETDLSNFYEPQDEALSFLIDPTCYYGDYIEKTKEYYVNL